MLIRNMLTGRQKTLLVKIVEQYISSAEPVASGSLSDRFSLSPATIRNEMGQLEEDGLIYQPYTSAGRIPTEAGFKFYLSKFLKEKKPSQRVQKILGQGWAVNDFTLSIKILSKKLAEISNEAVVVGFSPSDVYCTGLSNLFSKPEFNSFDLIIHASRLIDRLDEIMKELFERASLTQQSDGTLIVLGKENPFGDHCSTLLIRYQKDDQSGVLALLGPIRMSYQNNLGLINFSKNLIEGRL